MKAGVLAYFFLPVWSFVWGLKSSSESLNGVNCEEEYSFSYHYNRFHLVSDIANLTDDGFRLDFKVQAASNAHVLLSPKSFPGQLDMAYEIVFGANRNSNTDIRRGKGTTSKQRINTPNMVSSREIRGFWIQMHKDGRIMVGKENDTMPMLMWQDTSPLKIRFISFSTWRDVYGKWLFNCKNYKGEDEAKEEVITSSRPLTWSEKLIQDLLHDYDPYVAPRPSNSTSAKRTEIITHLVCRRVDLDEKRSTLDVYGTLAMSWRDEKLHWSPNDYGNITSLVLQPSDIWIPDMMLYNSAGPVSMDVMYGFREGMIVSHEGIVFWSPPAHFLAFCENIDLRKWPKDTQTCELRLGFWSQQHLLQLTLWENASYLEENRVETEWQVEEVTAETVWIRTPWANTAVELGMDIPLMEDGTDLVDPLATDDSGELEIVVHSSMALKLTLTRTNAGYSTVLVIPLAIKLALQCLSLVTVTLFFLVTWRTLPIHSDHVPSIVSAYKTAMIMTCVSIMATVTIIHYTRYPPVRNLPSLVKLVISSEWTAVLFFLPTKGEQVNKQYNSLEETPQLNEGQGKNDDLDLQWSWMLISTLVDRTMFFIYSILFFYIFSAFG
ncbi:acetylcholine receptor subunit alpha-like isoform X2 [Hetaerina americana]|uniref:acetylcholine receptor subunit alpha-like isoform X2 n=1 Tax=Hetaerina americana TaxID=62018 RepID=UPI003A7F3A39